MSKNTKETGNPIFLPCGWDYKNIFDFLVVFNHIIAFQLVKADQVVRL